MEISFKKPERGPVLAAILALILLGLVSLFITWRTLERQKQAVDEHMFLAARSILRGVEANLLRSIRTSPRHRGFVPPVFSPLTREMFRELVSEEDVVFLALVGPEGKFLITSEALEGQGMPIPPQAFETLRNTGSWQGDVVFNGARAMAYGIKARPMLYEVWMGMNHRPAPGKESFYLMVGLCPKKHTAQFERFKRAAVLQTGYVLLAAFFLWVLAFAYLRRRDQGRRLVSLERFQNKLFDNMPDGLVTLAPDGEITAANLAAGHILAGEDSELTGHNWNDFPFTPTEEDPEALDWGQWEFEGKFLETLSVPLRDQGDQRLVLIRDRTAFKSMEHDLTEAKRLAAIGSLAAGVAHEIRNPLGSLRGFAQFFADKFSGQEPYEAYARTMVQESDRLGRVVTDLLFLARPKKQNPRRLDILEVAESVKTLLRFDLEHAGAELVLDIGPPEVFADPDGLKQSLINLVANSLDALDESGGTIAISSQRQNGNVLVRVSDTGQGMDRATADKAMEPFFTAKDKGTGLGLAMVRTIMHGHKGQVLIDSEPGRGATVTLVFPHGPDDMEHQPHEPAR